MTALTAELRALVERFVADLDALVRARALDIVREALGERPTRVLRRSPPTRRPTTNADERAEATRGASAASGPATSSTRRGGARRQRRSLAEIEGTAQSILAVVRANPRSSAEKIKAVLALDKVDWLAPIAKLVASGALIQEGERRATTYSVPTPVAASSGPVKPIKRVRAA